MPNAVLVLGRLRHLESDEYVRKLEEGLNAASSLQEVEDLFKDIHKIKHYLAKNAVLDAFVGDGFGDYAAI